MKPRTIEEELVARAIGDDAVVPYFGLSIPMPAGTKPPREPAEPARQAAE